MLQEGEDKKMFNIKNKVYVKHIDKFAPHEGEFILLDGGEFADVYFPEDTNFLFRYDTLEEMIAEQFDNDYSKFWEYTADIEKLRIYVADDNDYAALFLYTLKELFETFEYLSDFKVMNLLEQYEIADFVQENRSIDYIKLIETYNKFEATGKLYTARNVAEIPLEFVLFLYDNELINSKVASVKISNMVEPMLTGYIESQLLKVKSLITSNYDVLEKFLGISGISTYSKLKSVIDADTFLKKLICDSIVDVHSDLDSIISLYTLAYAKETDTTEDDHVKELMMFVDLFTNSSVDLFIENIERLLALNFFTSRYLKFNDFVLKSYMA